LEKHGKLSKIKNNLDYLVVFIDMLLVLAAKLRKIAKTRENDPCINIIMQIRSY